MLFVLYLLEGLALFALIFFGYRLLVRLEQLLLLIEEQVRRNASLVEEQIRRAERSRSRDAEKA